MTLRRMMIAVLGAAGVLGLVLPAIRVGFDPSHQAHYHYLSKPSVHLWWAHTNPYWPRYMATLMGRTWDSDAHCRESGAGPVAFMNTFPFDPTGFAEVDIGDDIAAIVARHSETPELFRSESGCPIQSFTQAGRSAGR